MIRVDVCNVVKIKKMVKVKVKFKIKTMIKFKLKIMVKGMAYVKVNEYLKYQGQGQCVPRI